jgi:xanthine dehydrogenase accessory factor
MGDLKELTVLIIGAGEMASGVAHRLWRARLRVLLTELPAPLAVRRLVCFSEAVLDGAATVEGATARRIVSLDQAPAVWEIGRAHV